jgi:hypothetical protein
MHDSDDDLCIGAAAIAREIKDKLTPREVYRRAEEGAWPIFRLRGKLAAGPAAMRAESSC